MMRRPMARRPVGRGGLVGTAARTAVVAGTATAVVGGMSKHSANKAAASADAQAQAAAAQQAAIDDAAQRAVAEQTAAQAAAAPPPAPAAGGDSIAELERLAALKQQGILTDEEFAAAKARVLGL